MTLLRTPFRADFRVADQADGTERDIPGYGVVRPSASNDDIPVGK
jgi:hypothetical protein